MSYPSTEVQGRSDKFGDIRRHALRVNMKPQHEGAPMNGLRPKPSIREMKDELFEIAMAGSDDPEWTVEAIHAVLSHHLGVRGLAVGPMRLNVPRLRAEHSD